MKSPARVCVRAIRRGVLVRGPDILAGMDAGDGRRPSTPCRTIFVATLVLAGIGVVSSVIALVLDLVAEDGRSSMSVFWSIGFGAPVIASVGAILLFVLLQNGHRREEPPPPRVARAWKLSTPLPTVELGETGLRFPWALAVSTLTSTFSMLFLLLDLRTLRLEPIDLSGPIGVFGITVIAVSVGAAWWPFLPRAIHGGITARQVRRVGLVYLLGAPAGGLIATIDIAVVELREGTFAPQVLGFLIIGGVVAWRGKMLYDFAVRAERNGLAVGSGRTGAA